MADYDKKVGVIIDMKCPNCGHELEPGSGFCENCGMITSLENEEAPASSENKESAREVYNAQPETTDAETVHEPSDDGEVPVEDTDSSVPYELEADETEQIVPVVEYDEKDSEADEKQPGVRSEKSDFEDEYTEDGGFEEDEGYDGDEGAYEEENAEGSENDEYEDAEEEESISAEQDNDDGMEQEDEDDGLDDMYVTASKSKRNSVIIAVLIIAIVAVTAGAVTMIKNNFSKVPVNAETSQSETADTEKEKATTKPTSETDSETTENTTEETTDKQTTEKETTEKETAEKQTTEKVTEGVTEPSKETTTQKQTTTSHVTTTTKKPTTTTKRYTTTTKKYTTTTRPTTTKKPTTTAKPTTTKKPTTTTRPTTTKPSTTTDPYGFGTDKVEKPKTYLAASERYKVYVSTDSLTMRSKPSQSASRVVYVSLGESLTVYGKSQNGFTYVRSDRFGVYGWVSNSYISKTRPQAEETVVVPGLVMPDKQYANPKTMYVNVDIGVRLRKAPEMDAASVRSVSYGFPVKVTGYSSSKNGWVYVTDTTHGVTGWVMLSWLSEKQ